MRARRHLEDAFTERASLEVIAAALRAAKEADCTPQRIEDAQERLRRLHGLEAASGVPADPVWLREALSPKSSQLPPGRETSGGLFPRRPLSASRRKHEQLGCIDVVVASESSADPESEPAPYPSCDSLPPIDAETAWKNFEQGMLLADCDAVRDAIHQGRRVRWEAQRQEDAERCLGWLMRYASLSLKYGLAMHGAATPAAAAAASPSGGGGGTAELRRLVEDGKGVLLPLGLGACLTAAEAQVRRLEAREAVAANLAEAQDLIAAPAADPEVLEDMRRRLVAAIQLATDAGLGEGDFGVAEALRKRIHNILQDRLGAVRVLCRIRPLSASELAAGEQIAVRCVDGQSAEVVPSSLPRVSLGGGAGPLLGQPVHPAESSRPPNSPPLRKSVTGRPSTGLMTPGSPILGHRRTASPPPAAASRRAVSPPTAAAAAGSELREDLSSSLGPVSFHACLSPGTQEEVFEHVRDLVQSAVDGVNVTIFTYGPTGAGKTYTMYGRLGGHSRSPVRGARRDAGPATTMLGRRSLGGAPPPKQSVRNLGSPRTPIVPNRAVVTSGQAQGRFSTGQAPSGSRSPTAGRRFGFMDEPIEDPGICPRAAEELFRLLGRDRERFEFSVCFSMVELYCQRFLDLLSPEGDRVALKRRMAGGEAYLENVREELVTSVADVRKLMLAGTRERHQRETALNRESSRSHVICSLRVVSINKETGLQRQGKLLLVDLAGSERVKRSEAAGEGLREAIEVNRSLSALGDVLAALSRGEQHVPYRNHELTQMMQDSLGGTAKTVMLLNLAPGASFAEETRTALDFAQRIKGVLNKTAPSPTAAVPAAVSRTGTSRPTIVRSSTSRSIQ